MDENKNKAESVEHSLQDVLTGVRLQVIINEFEKRITELEEKVKQLEGLSAVNYIYGG